MESKAPSREGRMTAAKRSAATARKARTNAEAEERRARTAAEKKADAAEKRFLKENEGKIKRLSREILRKYRSEIKKAEAAGETSVEVDRTRWSGSYYDDDADKRTDAERLKEHIEDLAKERARTALEEDGYKLERDGWSKDTAWGAGSDPLPVAGSSASWLVISWE